MINRPETPDDEPTYLLCGVCREEYEGEQSTSFDEGTGICGPCDEIIMRGGWRGSAADDAACAADYIRKERLEEGWP